MQPVIKPEELALSAQSVSHAPIPSPGWCCPEHRADLECGGEVLICPAGHQFNYSGGIARFVSAEGYVASFGTQWNKYRTTQLDSHIGTSISRDRLIRCLGNELWLQLAGRQVLECGCGAGRFTEVLLSAGANVTSIDLSRAVDANAKNFPPGPRHRIAQADITRLPFQPQQFDVVLCLGVVQHTPNPEATIRSLWEQVKPGGTLVIDHYAHRWHYYAGTAPIFRAWLRRLRGDAAIDCVERLVSLLWPIHRIVGNRRWAQRLLSRVSPVRCYLHSLPQLGADLQYQWALLDTHDSLTDHYKHWRSKEEILSIFSELKASAIWCEYGGNGVEGRAMRRLAEDYSELRECAG